VPRLSDTSARDRLLESGAILMAEKGFSGVSVRAICKRAGTGINMIHHYFESKQGLLDAIVEKFSTHVFEVPMRLLGRPASSLDDFISRIELLFETTLDAYLNHRDVMMVVVREQADPPALLKYMGRFSEFLEEAKDNGFVREGLDTQLVAGALLDRLMNQVQFAPWIKRTYGIDLVTDHEYRKRWCQSNMDLFLNGMVP